jgi:hypothetical protein
MKWCGKLQTVAEFEIGGRYSGRQNVQVWSALPKKKVRKTWTEKSKVRTRSTFSGPCPDFLARAQQVAGARKTDAHGTEFRQVVHPFRYGPTTLGGPGCVHLLTVVALRQLPPCRFPPPTTWAPTTRAPTVGMRVDRRPDTNDHKSGGQTCVLIGQHKFEL